jgi:soluble lytic murein transglycosylase-like protein
MHISLPVLSLFLALSIASPVHADIFKYVDEDGTIHFSNVPGNPASKKVVKEKPYVEKKYVKATPASAGPADTKPRVMAAVYTPGSRPLDGCEPYAGIINSKCDKYGVDPSLVKSIIKAESNYNPTAVSNKGARGLMQLMPSTAADMGVSNSFDPEQNIEGGVRYFRYLLDTFAGDVELSVAAYNCGQGKVIRNGNCVPEISETKNYVKKVMRLSNNPVTGMTFSRPIYRVELKDGSILFTESPVSSTGKISLME